MVHDELLSEAHIADPDFGFIGQMALLDAMPSVLPQTKAARKALHRTVIDTLLAPID